MNLKSFIISFFLLCSLTFAQAQHFDDYFVDRTKTPRDEKGDYDYESLYALNIPLLNKHLQQLFDGEEITAYAVSDASEYAIVYGKNSKGVTGWFQLDLTDGSFQRFNTEDIELVPTPTPTPSPTPTPTPEPTATPVPTATMAPTPTTVVQAAAPQQSRGLFSDKLMPGACVVLFVLAVTFFILYIISKKKYERRFLPDEEFLDEAEDYD